MSARDRKRRYFERHRRALNPGQFVVLPHERPSLELLAERDARLALVPASLTAALLGDPLPGFSMLDRR